MQSRDDGASCPSGQHDQQQLPLLIDQLDPPLPPHALGVLKRAGLVRVDEVAAATDSDLLALFGIGQPTLESIRAVLAGQRPRHPLHQIPLEELRTALGRKLYKKLQRVHFRTAEQIAATTNAVLLDLCATSPASVRTIRNVTFYALADDYTTGAPVRLTGKQIREVIAFTAELALYAVEHNDLELRRRTRGLLQLLAPGLPEPGDDNRGRPGPPAP